MAAAGEDETLVIARGDRCFVILNRYPYASGHLMVLPARHVGELGLLDQEEMTEAMALVQHSVRTLNEVMAPNGFNVGLNLGQAAGAGIDEHIHLHVVPRWLGDTNFMPMLAGTHVLPQALAATRDALVARWPHV
jgi:ATP adenylyltransferase